MAYKLTSRASYLGQRIQYNWIFQVSAGTATAAILAEAFEFNVWTAIMLATIDDFVGTTMIIENLDNPLDFGEFPYIYTPNGQVAGDGMPSFVSCQMTFLRSRSDVRNGAKRFAGIPDIDVTNNTLSAGYGTKMTTVGDFLINGFSNIADDATFIVGYEATPKTTGIPEIITPTGYTVSPRVGTQNSRKFGHGV